MIETTNSLIPPAFVFMPPETETCGLIKTLLPAVFGLIGVFVGSWLMARNERQKRREDFIKQQLGEFYGPMLGFVKEITARHEGSIKIGEFLSHFALLMNEKGRGAAKDLLNETLQHEKGSILLQYQNMLAVFRSKIWLAEPTTRSFFEEIANIVISLEKTQFIEKSMPKNAGETWLDFYKNLEQTNDRLRNKLTNPRSIWPRFPKFWRKRKS